MIIDLTEKGGVTRRELKRSLEENLNFRLKEAHNRVEQERREQQRRRPPRRRQGAVRLSNTDSMGRARRVRAQLVAKLQEVYGSDADGRSRSAMAMDIKLQINRVDKQMAAIRRRERAIEEERTTPRRNDTPEARRRRARDMQERRINIRRDMLYSAKNGGFDPNNPTFVTSAKNGTSSVSFDIGGNSGTMDIAGGVDFTPAPNMEFVL
ncbi:MAG: hypothetical protein FWF80_03355 [Defluviitaleaceae bacterium]|nr:hypothetical protein [Defluviitaleaceae bacterium]